jgi:hypothetical protein
MYAKISEIFQYFKALSIFLIICKICKKSKICEILESEIKYALPTLLMMHTR